jgi:uncharacterized repeat protein (TIGR01451 family)
MPVNPGDPIKFSLEYHCVTIEENCDNARIVDQLPDEFSWDAADVTWAFDPAHISGASFDPGTGQVTFTFKNAPDFQGGSSGTVEVFATFKVGTPDGATVDNTATFTADGAPEASSSSSATVSADNTPDLRASKTARTLSADVGDEVIWTFGGANAGGTTIDSWVWNDNIDTTLMDVTRIDVGTTGNRPGAAMTATVQIATDGNPALQSLGTFTLTSSTQTINVADLGLGGDKISRIVITYTDIPIGFSQSGAGGRPTIYADVLAFPPDGELDNCLTLEGTDDGTIFETSSPKCGTIYNQPVQSPHLHKTKSANIVKIGDVLTYTIWAGSRAGSIPVDDATVVDLLPNDVTYVPGSWVFDDEGSGVSAPTFEIIEDYNG